MLSFLFSAWHRFSPVSSDPVTIFDDGHILRATLEGLSVSFPVSDAQTHAKPVVFPWWQVQTIRWIGDLGVVSVAWTDPGRERLSGVVTQGIPVSFMEAANEFLRASMVLFRKVKADNGTTVVVQVRRDKSGELVSVSTADGPLDDSGRQLAASLEDSVREAVGLSA